MTDDLAYDDLPPTQQLILEVLAARHRLSEPHWPIDSKNLAQLNSLQGRGLVTHDAAPTPGDRRTRLTPAGERMMLDDGYVAPRCLRKECTPAEPLTARWALSVTPSLQYIYGAADTLTVTQIDAGPHVFDRMTGREKAVLGGLLDYALATLRETGGQ